MSLKNAKIVTSESVNKEVAKMSKEGDCACQKNQDCAYEALNDCACEAYNDCACAVVY